MKLRPPLAPPAAVAFDLDGTLVDSRGDIAAACNHTLAWAGRAPLPVDQVASFVGDGARTLLARAFGISKGSPELEPLHEEFVRYYTEHPAERTHWMPGALASMAALEARGIPFALMTNKARPVALALLHELGVRTRFAAVFAGGDGPLKPDPHAVTSIARDLGVDVRATWVVGDAAQDVEAGRAAGAITIGVLGGFHAEERLRGASPDLVLASLEELPALLSPHCSGASGRT
jgi:2-phosphoglycolate phosphatase